MYKKIAVSNRKIFFSHHTKSSTTDFVNHLAELCKIVDFIILREKDLSLTDYKKLASTVINRCNGKKTQIILHSHIDCCHELNYKKIHLPLPIFTENLKMLKDFETVGVSVHSLEQAIFAEKNNASYRFRDALPWHGPLFDDGVRHVRRQGKRKENRKKRNPLQRPL